MTLAIKYCGGCNPTYDRVAYVTELKEFLSDLEVSSESGCPAKKGYPQGVSFVSYDENKQFDYCLLVRGCNRSCVSDKTFSNCRHFYMAADKEDFLEIKTKLHAQIEKDSMQSKE